MSETIDLISAAFAKTATGQQEIQQRSLGLSPMVRRILVLVDGQRCGRDLATFAAGSDIAAILGELVDKGCIQARQREMPEKSDRRVVGALAETPSTAREADTFLTRLPPAAERTAAQNEMARNFMINTVNTIFGQHTRLSLIESIAHASGTDGLRQAFLGWKEAMTENRAGSKRLPEFMGKLVAVL
ncbi:hypothetical protein [Hydrogenophaga electricum]|uniref:MarR family transcriptional regulator n=1 Tax=Hydrogenophaga electricum TaxID=1230953 RepID=A0ABQ6C7Q4_9BURK|nr:hypothetical protein [Hydrogenophaga electricum]GLS14346.1 hypothetical protein GCM10007935_17770 [Hydrogenophaga electricum]